MGLKKIAALQRWTIAHAEMRRAQASVKAAERVMEIEHDEALAAVRAVGGQTSVGLLDGQRFAVEDYRDSGLLTAAPVVEE